MRDYKLVMLGAGGVGKSSLTVQYVQNVYMDGYDPTIEDSYRRTADIDGRQCALEILDTAGIEQFTAMRELYIKNGEGFVLVYSVTDHKSIAELASLRDQIVRIKDNASVPIVLVANKCDLEHDRQISTEEGIAMANQWGKVPFYECSAKVRTNVDEVFTDLIRQIMRRDSAIGPFDLSDHAGAEHGLGPKWTSRGSSHHRYSQSQSSARSSRSGSSQSSPPIPEPDRVLNTKKSIRLLRAGGRKVSSLRLRAQAQASREATMDAANKAHKDKDCCIM